MKLIILIIYVFLLVLSWSNSFYVGFFWNKSMACTDYTKEDYIDHPSNLNYYTHQIGCKLGSVLSV